MKFSDIPHFIMKGYIDRLLEIFEFGSFDNKEKTLINPDFIYRDRSNKHYWNNNLPHQTWDNVENETWATNSYLYGPRTTITTECGDPMELYLEGEDYYIPIKLKLIPDPQGPYEGKDKFNFIYYPFLNRTPVDIYETIEETHYYEDGDSYKSYVFEIYDIWNSKIEIKDGSRIFFRKNSLFHEWMRDHSKKYFENEYAMEFIYDHYLNVNKPFIYFGQIYENISEDQKYYVFHYNLYDYIVKAIPEHQRTPKLKDFFYLFIDILHNSVYHPQKDIWSQIDSTEARKDFLGNIGTYYGLDLDILNIDEQLLRWFIKQLPLILKTKGSISSFYNSYIHLTWNSENRLNIYEKWHDKSIEGNVNKSDYYKYLYTSQYDKADFESGAGTSWYLYYFDDVDHPTLEEKKRHMIKSLYKDNKLTNYQDDYDIAIVKRYNYYKNIDEDKTEWNVKHNLNTWQILVDVYDKFNKKIKPKQIQIKDNQTVQIIFREDQNYKNGKILVGYSDEVSRWIESESKVYTHNLDTENIIVQMYDRTYSVCYPEQIKIIDSNNIEVKKDDTKTYLVLSKGYQINDEEDNRMISTNYDIELDLSTAPVDQNSILTEQTISTLYYFWDQVCRPINRVADYKMLVAPETNMTGYNNNIYTDEFYPYLETKTMFPARRGHGIFVAEIDGKSTIQHNLFSENLIFAYYDKQYEYFDNIEKIKILDKNFVEVTLKENIPTYIFIKRCRGSFKRFDIEDGYAHGLESENIIGQFFHNNYVKYPTRFEIVSGSAIKTNLHDFDWWTLYKAEHRINHYEESDTWYIEHNLNRTYLISDCYNEDKEKIVPKRMEIIDPNNMKITFSKPKSGYVLISPVAGYDYEKEDDNVFMQRITGKELNITHDLDSTNVMCFILDTEMNWIDPEEMKIVDKHNISISLYEERTVFVLLRRTSLTSEQEISNDITAYYKDNEIIKSDQPPTVDYDKLVLKSANEKIKQSESSKEWTINHNFNTKNILVNVHDDNNNKITPETIQLIDNSTIYLNFDYSVSGTVSISLSEHNSYFVENGGITYSHNLYTRDVIVQLYDENYKVFVPDKIEIIDNNTIRIENSEVVRYRICMNGGEEVENELIGFQGLKQYQVEDNEIYPINYGNKSSFTKMLYLYPDYSYEKTSESDIWEINHNLDNTGLLVDVYDNNNKKISYSNIELVDSNNMKIYFDQPQKGIAFAKRIFSRDYVVEDMGYEEYSEGSEHHIEHNLNTDRLIVHVYNEMFRRIYPKNMEIVNNNELKIHFNNEKNVYIMIKGVEMGTDDYWRMISWVVYTPKNINNFILQQFANNVYKKDSNLKKLDENTFLVSDWDVDKVTWYDAEVYNQRDESVEEDIIEHYFQGLGVITDIYDEDGWKTKPENIVLEGTETHFTYKEPIGGKSLATFVGDLEFIQYRTEILPYLNTIRVNDTINNFESYVYEFPILEIRDEKGYTFLHSKVPKGYDVNIKEMGIFTEDGTLVFYSECSDLYKHNDFDLNVFYKIKKRFLEEGELTWQDTITDSS